ncbi:MAG: IPT/TIG domain-containing protein [Treponema sp.]|nr:IPT/TIG domain-containing protein [Treponema sp.]
MLNSFSYIFRKYPLFRTFIWLIAIAIVVVVISLFNRQVTSAPVLSSINPSVASPGDVIVLRGDHFGNMRNNGFVEIGGERLTASSYLSWTDDEIKVLLPSNVQEGLVIVDISGNRSKPGVFTNETTIPVTVPVNTMSKMPSITSLSSESAGIGQVLIITGQNFGDSRKDSKVLFATSRTKNANVSFIEDDSISNKIYASTDDFDYESWSDSEIRVRVPDGAVSGDVFVLTEKGLSSPQNLKVLARGRKTFSNEKSYVIKISADISNIKAATGSSFTLHIPRPEVCAFQPEVEMAECSPQPLLENYHNSVIHQVEFNEIRDNKQEFSQNFIVKVYEISCTVNKDQVRPFADKTRPLFVEYTSPTAFIPSDNPQIAELASSIVKKERNPYNQAQLVYKYLLKNFALLQFSKTGDFLLDDVINDKTADAYDFSMLFVSLLRSLKIPAKIMSGVLVDNELKTRNHWWNEFYIENFGWVPVDLALGAGLDYNSFQQEEDRESFYFGNLDSQHILFSSDWNIIKSSLANNKIVYRPRSYALQNIWEESSAGTDSYSSFWNNPVILGVY